MQIISSLLPQEIVEHVATTVGLLSILIMTMPSFPELGTHFFFHAVQDFKTFTSAHSELTWYEQLLRWSMAMHAIYVHWRPFPITNGTIVLTFIIHGSNLKYKQCTSWHNIQLEMKTTHTHTHTYTHAHTALQHTCTCTNYTWHILHHWQAIYNHVASSVTII